MKNIIIVLLTLTLLLSGCASLPNDNAIPSTTTAVNTYPIQPTTPPTQSSTKPQPTINSSTPTEQPIIPLFKFEKQNFEHKQFDNLKDLRTEMVKLHQYTIDFIAACCDYLNQLTIGDFSSENNAAWSYYNTVLLVEQERLQVLMEVYFWDYRTLEYPIATEVWLYMTNDMGYSNYVAAGIMGNMMAECGGLTLKLDWTATNKTSGCYGLCQWHPKYHKEVQGANLQEQLKYMSVSFPKVMSRSYNRERYNINFTYEDFLALTDVEEAAKAFCLIYENPGRYDSRRGTYAIEAFKYFTMTTERWMEE